MTIYICPDSNIYENDEFRTLCDMIRNNFSFNDYIFREDGKVTAHRCMFQSHQAITSYIIKEGNL